MITETQVEKALDYLRDTAEDFAYWRGRVASTEYLIKMVEATEFLEIPSGAQEYKKSKARASEAYKKAVNDYEEALVKHMELQSKRKAAEMKISYFQTSIRAKTQGMLL